jgi:hypothetical protein
MYLSFPQRLGMILASWWASATARLTAAVARDWPRAGDRWASTTSEVEALVIGGRLGGFAVAVHVRSGRDQCTYWVSMGDYRRLIQHMVLVSRGAR